MKLMSGRPISLLLLLLSWPNWGLAAPVEPVAMPEQWTEAYVILLESQPRNNIDQEQQRIMQEHIQYQLWLQQQGTALAAGGFAANTPGFAGMTLVHGVSRATAEDLAESDPAVAAGLFTARVITWYIPAGQLPEP